MIDLLENLTDHGLIDNITRDYESFKRDNKDFTPIDRTVSMTKKAHMLWRAWLIS